MQEKINNPTYNCNELPNEPVTIFHNLSINSDSVESDKIDEHIDCNLNQVESEEELFYKNQRIHPAIPCNKLEAMQMILMYFMRHNLTFAALEDVIKLINNILKLDALPASKYKFFKLFSGRYKPTNVFFCKLCSNEIEVSSADSDNAFVICEICQTSNTCSSTASDNYFVTLPIEDQLKEIVRNKLQHFVRPTSNSLSTTTISDITDGAIYKKLQTHERKITLTLNTDGVQIVKSKSKSLWPIQATVNELPPEERFLSKNILLLGLWYNEKHPEMQILLKPFVLELNKLKSSGMIVDVNQEKINFEVTLICGSFDGPAKATVQNLTQHNGYYSCHYCEDRGEAVPVNDSGTLQVRYPFREGVKRTAKEAISNMKEASQKNNKLPVKGNIKYTFSLYFQSYI